VSSAKQRVIAIAGDWSDVQIGTLVADDVARAAETFDLHLGSESFGRLLIPQPRTTPPRLVKSDLHTLRAAGAWLAALALVVALMLSAYLLRIGRSPDRGQDDPPVARSAISKPHPNLVAWENRHDR